MKINDIVENEDGSARLDLDLTTEEVKMLVELAVNVLLKQQTIVEDAKDV